MSAYDTVWILEAKYKPGQRWAPYSVFGRCFYTESGCKEFEMSVRSAWRSQGEAPEPKFRCRKYVRSGGA